LEALLAHTRASVSLRIEAMHAAQAESLQRLLHRLRRYGDRISISIDESLTTLVPIDSSVFHLELRVPG